MRESAALACRNLTLDCYHRPQVVGILNVTEDSFYDGGRYLDTNAALAHAAAMIAGGAAAIDVGGASSRPRGKVYGAGAPPVPPHVEAARVVPVIEALAARFPETVISVDTFHVEVARVALEAGAHMVNDITGLRIYPEMADLVARYGASLIVMHAIGAPGNMPHEHTYHDVVGEVRRSLERSIRIATLAGVTNLVVDPGFGFGKSAQQNLRLLAHLDALGLLGCPIMVGISRKSTIGQVLRDGGQPAPVEERLFGTLGATAVAVMRGAQLVRTHDVKPTVELIKGIVATEMAQ